MSLLWNSPEALSRTEKLICKRLKQSGKLFIFLREQRHQIFNEELSTKLDAMYHDHPRGKPTIAPAVLAMATILQAYGQQSDAEAVLESVFDKRWQMVLGCLNEEEPPFSQGTICDFRHRLIKYDMDKKLHQRIIEVAKEFGGFCFKKLRIALDSAPLQGAGRVEDTFNLVGHALELVVGAAAFIKNVPELTIHQEADTQIIGKSSIKAALDIDWSDPNEKNNALNMLLADVKRMTGWLAKQDAGVTEDIGLTKSLELLKKLIAQDIEPDPDGGARVKKGVAKDRQISISDNEMRHGRKSASRTINGYKQHIGIDLDSKLILATRVRPANEPEHEAAALLKDDIIYWGDVEEYQIDRGYLAAAWTTELYDAGKRVVSKPWTPAKTGRFTKNNFSINLEGKTVTCPAGEMAQIKGAEKQAAKFSKKTCNSCSIKEQCTISVNGRQISIHAQEAMLIDFKHYTKTSEGRSVARERVKVEHSLASICNRKGHRARYTGVRKNEFDLNRTAMISNLHIAMKWAA
jgi:hypothetical protein